MFIVTNPARKLQYAYYRLLTDWALDSCQNAPKSADLNVMFQDFSGDSLQTHILGRAGFRRSAPFPMVCCWPSVAHIYDDTIGPA